MVLEFDSYQVQSLRSYVLGELHDLSNYFRHLDEYAPGSSDT